MKKAFTLIEVLVSVMIISIVVLGIMKMREQTISSAQYISQRLQSEFSNSLFLTPDILKYTKEKKSAYDLLKRFNITNDKTREILQNNKKEIIVTPLPIEKLPFTIKIYSIILHGDYSAKFYTVTQ